MPNGPVDSPGDGSTADQLPTARPGPLVAIGGAEDKLGRRSILSDFVELAGGADARIAVVPTASSLGSEVVDVYEAIFRKLGAREVVAARPETREEAEHPAYVGQLDDVTGVFMTGGNQLKLSGVIDGTAFGEALVAAHRRGAVVGGTSAGASILSSHMVAFGPGGSTPKQRMTQLASGLGLVRDVVIDQHFAQRNRYGRLLMLVAQSPGLLGIGVDEDTAAIISDEGDATLLRVSGRGAVTVLDARAVVSNAHEARRTAPLLASGVVLHVLPRGAVFDMTTRTLVREEQVVDPAEADELAVAGRDLKRLARDIAADDVSPSDLRRRRARHASGDSGDSGDFDTEGDAE
jgi:cyanophycinase